MKLYEEGIALSRTCRKELENAELRITELRARAEGGFDEASLDF
jgi:exodeoxyribonuclease VII small subunit